VSGYTRETIRRFNIKPTKSLGQNFLQDESVVNKIVNSADISDNDIVVEIGPGTGAMTFQLAKHAEFVAAVEIDRRLIPVLNETLGHFSNVSVINMDILDIDLKNGVINGLGLGDRINSERHVKVVANLPYYITTPIIMKFLEETSDVDTMVFMVQKEVADRMTAKSGGKDYGALSVAVQYYSKPEKLFNVPPHCFIPQPEVESTVIKLSRYEKPPVDLEDKDVFFKVVKAAFAQRRKTLVNALYNSPYFNKSKDELKDILEGLGIKENQRGETLSITQFAQLANTLVN